MKLFTLSVLVLTLFLSGCATVTMTKSGEDITWTSKTLWKDLDAVDAQAIGKEGNFTFGLGASGSALTAAQIACLINPAFCSK